MLSINSGVVVSKCLNLLIAKYYSIVIGMTHYLCVLMFLGRPSTAWPQTAAYRPGSALKPQSAFRPPTAVGHSPGREPTPDSGRPSTSSRPVSNLSLGQNTFIDLPVHLFD